MDKEFFDRISTDRMSVMATQREINNFRNELPSSMDYYDKRYFRNKNMIKSVSSYDFSHRKLADLMYVKKKNTFSQDEIWELHQREAGTVLWNTVTSEYIDIKNNHRDVYEISYLRDIPMYQFQTYGLPKGFKWSRMRSKNVNYVQDYLKPNVLARYAMFQRPTNGLSNVLIDSFIPKLMYQYNFDLRQIRTESNLPSTSLTISPWFSELFQTKQIEVEQMARILGYSKKDIKNLLVAVKKKQHNITFIGYGGTNVNTIHWLTQLCSLTHTLHPFKHVAVYEPDVLEVSNLFRFPKNPESIISSRHFNKAHSKLIMLTDYELKTLSKTKPIVKSKFVDNFMMKYDTNIQESIIYGAPSLSTREELGKYNLRFLSATHTGNTCYIHSNPVQDSELQVETYGLIQLSIFFMNQLKLAISFLEILANDDIDLYVKDVEHLNYTFSQDESLTTDRKYNFQLDHSGHMVTEEEANAVV